MDITRVVKFSLQIQFLQTTSSIFEKNYVGFTSNYSKHVTSSYPSIAPWIAKPNGFNLSYPSMCHNRFGPYNAVKRLALRANRFFFNISPLSAYSSSRAEGGGGTYRQVNNKHNLFISVTWSSFWGLRRSPCVIKAVESMASFHSSCLSQFLS